MEPCGLRHHVARAFFALVEAMARIRTIKPEFWTSEQIVECSPTARLLFIGMWNFCDDGGNLTASLKGLKLRVLPADDLSLAKIDGMVKELIANRLLREYSVNDCKYWHVTGWHHQKIEKPSLKYPQPDDEDSTTVRRPFDDQTPADVSSSEGKGIVEDVPLVPLEAVELAEQMKSLIFANNPEAKISDKAVRSWAQEAEKMFRLDRRIPASAVELLNWCQHDSFWSSNILSMKKFRKQYDQLAMKHKNEGVNGNGAKFRSRHEETAQALREWSDSET